MFVVNLPKETTLAGVKTSVHTVLSSYFPTEFTPSMVRSFSVLTKVLIIVVVISVN